MGLALAIVVTARSSLADHYFVPSGSMLPTVEPEDHVFVDKLAYGLRVPLLGDYALHFSPPARGDVVVLLSPDDGIVLLKRVVGLPGDRVTITRGTVVIDGRPMPVFERGGASLEDLGAMVHAISLAAGGGPDFGPVRIPAGRYLVLGDNRGDSRDGRYFGLVTRDAIMGRVEGVILRHGAPTWVGLGR
ncbi:MAG: signal peptidase I [Polyangiaceae bacterium]|jgi:signal peptidase I